MAETPSLLLVEPHADTRAIVERVVKGWGWNVVTAAGGRAALRLVSKCNIDLALIHTELPDVDVPISSRGCERSTTCRSSPRPRHLSVTLADTERRRSIKCC